MFKGYHAAWIRAKQRFQASISTFWHINGRRCASPTEATVIRKFVSLYHSLLMHTMCSCECGLWLTLLLRLVRMFMPRVLEKTLISSKTSYCHSGYIRQEMYLSEVLYGRIHYKKLSDIRFNPHRFFHSRALFFCWLLI